MVAIGSAVALAVERIVQPVEGMHRGIAGSWFAAAGPVARPVQMAHDAVARIVYGSIRLGARGVGAALDAAVDLRPGTADSVQAVINGFWGNDLGHHERSLGSPMTVRDARGRPVQMDGGLAAAFPAATGRLAVLVHGLMRTERCWHDTDARRGLHGPLANHPELTPLPVRYNTGLEVAANGERLASLLEEVHSAWPVPVRSIALVGHSMGGLVVQSACARARRTGHRWIDQVGDVVAIGSPHRGAPLEKLVTAVAWGLGVAPQTRPLADFVNSRSDGIKDLRFGVDSLGAGTDEAAGLGSTGDIRHHFVAGVITSDPTHPVGAVVGDLMVRPASSTSAPRLEPTNVAVLGGVHHFDLLHEPDVIETVMRWLDPDAA